jgi:hypothetical protein
MCRVLVGNTKQKYTGFWWGNFKERDHLENHGIDGRIILKLI